MPDEIHDRYASKQAHECDTSSAPYGEFEWVGHRRPLTDGRDSSPDDRKRLADCAKPREIGQLRLVKIDLEGQPVADPGTVAGNTLGARMAFAVALDLEGKPIFQWDELCATNQLLVEREKLIPEMDELIGPNTASN